MARWPWPAKPPADFLLAPDEVHVWYARCDGGDDAASVLRYASALSPSEQEQSRRFVFEPDRRQFLTAHALLRVALSCYAGIAPEAWRFAQGARGKPQLACPPGPLPLQFNLSGTTGLVAVAITLEDEVGIDVEDTQRNVDLDVARVCCSGVERAHLARLLGAERTDVFLQYWTLKEAYLKARGLGLSLPPSEFSFHLAPDRPPQISFAPGFDDDPGRWQFYQHRPTGQHCLAVAVRRPAGARSSFVVRDICHVLRAE